MFFLLKINENQWWIQDFPDWGAPTPMSNQLLPPATKLGQGYILTGCVILSTGGTAADGTHPTGMHSCSAKVLPKNE